MSELKFTPKLGMDFVVCYQDIVIEMYHYYHSMIPNLSY